MILAWLLPWGLLAAVLALACSSLALPPARLRWYVAATLAAPLTCPQPGLASGVSTAFAIIVAVRLLDLASYRNRRQPTAFEALLWLLIPVIRGRPLDPELRAANRARALRPLAWALGQRLVWELLARSVAGGHDAPAHWLLRSLLLIAFFVLNFTALASLGIAVALALGFDVEPAFEAPFLSRSPREFWSRRWNKFIARFLLKRVALALPRGLPSWMVIGAVFLASGILHEYFAFGAGGQSYRGGFMTLFFLLQGFMVFIETKLPLRGPRALGIGVTLAWMAATSPLFFYPLAGCLQAFGYPADWLPF